MPNTESLSSLPARVSSIKRIVQAIFAVWAVVTVFWHLYYAWSFPMTQDKHAMVHFGMLIGGYYLLEFDLEPADRRDHLHNLLTGVFFVGTIYTTVYAFTHFEAWLVDAQRFLDYGFHDLFVGAVAIVIVIHATYRAFGLTLALVGVFTIFYGLFGPHFPGLLQHSGFTLDRLLFINSIDFRGGVWGYLMGVGATWVVIFIFFAGIVEGFGGMDYITKLGQRMGRGVEAGVVQVAVITSFIVGSIMGGSASNVATTGSFTIPLMKDRGVRSEIAGAIESIASTGGQILPPVMGSAAFIMADILGISYFDVVAGAILPALLYFLPVAFIVQLSAMKYGWGGGEDDAVESPAETERTFLGIGRSIGRSVFDGLPLIGSFIVLVYVLLYLRYDPLTGGMYAIFAAIGFGVLQTVIRGRASLSTAVTVAENTTEGCKKGVENMAPLTAVIGLLGVVVTIITQSGFAQKFTFFVLGLGGDVGILVLVLIMIVSLLFGLGMPTPAAYIVVAIMSAPVLVELGIQPLVAHMFVFYFALLSSITPPVALSCAVAAGIAGTSFYTVARETIRLGIYTFLVPFIFVYSPALIYWDGTTGVTFLMSVIGLFTFGIALAGYNVQRDLAVWERGIFAVLALALLFAPAFYARELAWLALGLIVVWFLSTTTFNFRKFVGERM